MSWFEWIETIGFLMLALYFLLFFLLHLKLLSPKEWRKWWSELHEGRVPWWVKVIVLAVGTYRLWALATRRAHFGQAGGDLFGRTGGDWFDLLILASAIGLGFLMLSDEYHRRNTIPQEDQERGYRVGYRDATAGRIYSPNREDRPHLDGYEDATNAHPFRYYSDDAAVQQQYKDGYAAGLEDRTEDEGPQTRDR